MLHLYLQTFLLPWKHRIRRESSRDLGHWEGEVPRTETGQGGEAISRFPEVAKTLRMNLESDERSADVELLAECGQIAHRLRSLERTWSIELKDLQKKTVQSYARPALPSTHSVNQKLDEIFDNNEPSTTRDEKDEDADDPKIVNRLKYLEDTVVKIHRQQDLQSGRPTASNKTVPIRSNMNYSEVKKTLNNNNDLTTPPNAIHEDDQLSSTSAGDSVCRDNNNKSLISDNADDADSLNLGCRNHPTVHQQHMCANIQNDDLRMLIRELKRKVDFTEKMNWLCKLLTHFDYEKHSRGWEKTGTTIYEPKILVGSTHTPRHVRNTGFFVENSVPAA